MKKSYSLFVLTVAALTLMLLFSISVAPIAVSAQSRPPDANLDEVALAVNKQVDLEFFRIELHFLQDSGLIIDIYDQDGGE